MKNVNEKIRNIKKKEKFFINDKYLDSYAKICRYKATLVYVSLCRHSNKDQTCFPSIELMAKQHNVGRDTIMDGVKILIRHNIIKKIRIRKTNKQWLNNTYILIDKSKWKTQVGDIDLGSHVDKNKKPDRQEQLNRVAGIDSNETHDKETNIKVTNNGYLNKIDELMRYAKDKLKFPESHIPEHKNKFYISLCINKCDGIEGVKNIIDIVYESGNWKDKINSFESLYSNIVNIKVQKKE